MADDYGDDIRQHEDLIRRLIQIAAHQDTINEDLRAFVARQDTLIARLDARMTAQEERQGRHETRMDTTIARLDATLARFDATLDRLDATLQRWLERGTNGREA